jgi:hypothetical protein
MSQEMNEALLKEGEQYAKRIKAFLDSRQQPFTLERFKSRSIFRYEIEHSDGPIQVEILAKPFSDYFSLFAKAPVPVPETSRDWFLSVLTGTTFSDSALRQEINLTTGEVRVGFSSLLCPEWVTEPRLTKMIDHSTTMIETMMGMIKEMAEKNLHPVNTDDRNDGAI